jgi:translation elongation factor EF-G
LTDLSPVDSDALFELAARMGYREVAKAAGAVILEPIMKMGYYTEENMGDIVGDINRRSQVNDMGDSSAKTIKQRCYQNGYTTLRTFHLVDKLYGIFTLRKPF